jgi:hypothetical protein
VAGSARAGPPVDGEPLRRCCVDRCPPRLTR